MLNILLSGCRGKLCASVAECADGQTDLRVVGGIDRASGQAMPFPVFSAPETVALPDANRPNVVIDCSHPSALPGLLAFCVEQRCPLVVATTGYGENEQALLAEAGRSIPIFYGRNMSLGINLLRELVKSAARVLGSDFDVEIVESHHSQKIDAPSGTALILAEAINEAMEVPYAYCYERQSRSEPRRKPEIGIHSVRGGTIIGDHSVIFAGLDEVITLNHSAGSKRLFAVGCLRAARYTVLQPPGNYGMEDLVDFCACG